MIGGEFELIRRIRELVNSSQCIPDSVTGIGDDCAVYKISENRFGLFTTDMSIEKRHFDLNYTSWYDAGYRSMTANISDIYAMAGRPVMAFISAGVPAHASEENVLESYRGMIDCANRHGVTIAGGDTVSSDSFLLGISLYGETSSPVMRSGAEPGHFIYCTGSLGGSLLGLEVLKSREGAADFTESVMKHLRPEPYAGVEVILRDYSPSSMIDISDGLLSDLNHICEESGCGFELFAQSIPVSAEVESYCSGKSIDPLSYAMYSGEEYELIFTSPKEIKNGFVSLMGRIIPEGYYIIKDNVRTGIVIEGFDHFITRG